MAHRRGGGAEPGADQPAAGNLGNAVSGSRWQRWRGKSCSLITPRWQGREEGTTRPRFIRRDVLPPNEGQAEGGHAGGAAGANNSTLLTVSRYESGQEIT